MNKTSWVEICVSDFEQSITWFENVLGFRVVARDANDYAELSHGETSIQLAPDNAPYWASERPHLLPPGLQKEPQVLFTVDDSRIIEVRRRRDGVSRGYFRIPGPIGDYVSITVIAFRNLS